MKHCIACNTEYGDDIESCPTDGTTLYSIENKQAPDALIGMLLDKKYRIEKRLGEGGMGVVYQATHIHIESTVAIKVLHKDLVSNPQSVERFRREARAAGRIHHPNAISVIDFGVAENNLVYIVMEYLEGLTLAQRIRKLGRVMPEETVAIMRDVCAALDAAHNKGVIHRDLKPDNIILQRVDGKDRVKVLDFGIAQLKSLSGVSMELTQQGTVIGTPFYMSPEQCRGEELDKRSDVYSLGIILFEMLTGRLPFQAETAMAMIVKHMTEQPPRLREIQPDVPALFEVVTLRALAKNKTERQGSAAELGSELDNALAKSKFKPGQGPVKEDLYKTTIRGETRVVGGIAGSETEIIGGQVTSPIHAEGEAGARTEVISASPSTALDAVAGDYSTVVTSAGAGTARGTPAAGNYETTVMPGGSTSLPAGTPSRGYTGQIGAVRRASRMSMYVSVGAVVLVGVALAVGWYVMNQSKSTTSTNSTGTTTVPTIPSGPVIPDTMLKIPEGTFNMGRNDGKNEDEKPAHSVTVASFHMGKFEITNKEYQEFVKTTNYQPPAVSQEERQIYKDSLKPTIKDESLREPPAGWTGTEFPPGEDNLPVTNVSWNDAVEYCKWLSTKTGFAYRLPTEEEWEYTAKGTDQRVYPWGNNFDPSYTNSLERIQTAFGSSVHPMNVLQFKDAASPFDTAGQAGNVAEWTASMAKIYPGSKFPPIVGDFKVVRGGSFVDEKFGLSTTARNWLKPERKIPWLGFRVAMDPPPTTASK